MEKTYDVSISGAGPIGGYVAGNIASKGYKVSIFEQRKKIGEPLGCAGLVTSRVFDFLDITKNKIIQNKIKGAHIHSPFGNTLEIGGNKINAFVIDRKLFDREIIKNSIDKGAELFLENRILKIQRQNKEIILKSSKNNICRCNLLIGADGPYSKTRDQFSLPKPKEILKGIGAEVKNTKLDPDFVEIYVGRNIAPNFFAWVIPINKYGTKARIGLCVDRMSTHSTSYYFDKFLKEIDSDFFLKKTNITEKIVGSIPLGPLKKTYSSNVLLVGDAAAQVKPTSGGGIYTGLLCGKHCAYVSIEALKNNDFTSHFLKKYHKLWALDIGRELYLGMKFRKIFQNLTDKQIDSYIKKFQNYKINQIISNEGDIDYPSKLIKPLLTKNPSLLKLIFNLLKK